MEYINKILEEQEEIMARGPNQYTPQQSLGTYPIGIVEANDYGVLEDTDCGVDRVVSANLFWADPALDGEGIAALLEGFEDIDDPLEPNV